jgi:hypothetical protein
VKSPLRWFRQEAHALPPETAPTVHLPQGLKLPPVKDLFYLAFSEGRMVLRRVAHGRQWEIVPQFAVDERDRPRIIGAEAEAVATAGRGLRLRRAFGDRETLVSDVDAAVLLMLYGLTLMVPRRWRPRMRTYRPHLILHPLERDALTPLEEMGLQELGRRAHARSVHVWTGAELTLEPIATFRAALAGFRPDLGRIAAPLNSPWR